MIYIFNRFNKGRVFAYNYPIIQYIRKDKAYEKKIVKRVIVCINGGRDGRRLWF